MGRRGPPKKPVELALVQGNPREKKLPPPIKAPRMQSMKPPKELGRVAKGVWRKTIPKLRALNLISSLDTNMLARYCDTYEHYLKAREFVLKHGTSYAIYQQPVPTPEEQLAGVKPIIKYMVQFPQVRQMNQWARDLSRYEQPFGMSPASRAALSYSNPQGAAPSEVEALLFGTG